MILVLGIMLFVIPLQASAQQSKVPTFPNSPILSDSEKQAVINAALSVPGLKAWSNQWQYGWMDFSGTTTSGWQYAIVHLRLPVNASAPLSCVFPSGAAIMVDLSTYQVVKADYPTLQNFNCNMLCTGGPGMTCPTYNTIIKNTTAYDIYIANYGSNSTVPEFPFVLSLLTILIGVAVLISRKDSSISN